MDAVAPNRTMQDGAILSFTYSFINILEPAMPDNLAGWMLNNDPALAGAFLLIFPETLIAFFHVFVTPNCFLKKRDQRSHGLSIIQDRFQSRIVLLFRRAQQDTSAEKNTPFAVRLIYLFPSLPGAGIMAPNLPHELAMAI